MKHSPVARAERHEFSHLSSMPWRRLPGSSSTPWLGFDPGLRSDCSAAYRAFRLVMLALFALLGAGSRVQAQSSSQPESGAAAEAQGQQIAELKTLVLRQAQSIQSQQQVLNDPRNGQGAVLPTRAVVEDRRESAHLKVNRAHAPPPTTNPSNVSGSVYPATATPTNLLPEILQDQHLNSTSPNLPISCGYADSPTSHNCAIVAFVCGFVKGDCYDSQ